jgi:hypothetical protein
MRANRFSARITYKAMQNDTNLRWTVTQGVWSFGASGLADYLSTKSKLFTMEGGVGKIQCPCLVLDAEGEILVGGHQAQDIYDALECPKQLVRFTKEDGAENHCESARYRTTTKSSSTGWTKR